MAAFDAHGGKTPSWWDATAPTTGPTGTAAIWVMNRGGFEVPGRVFGFRCYVANTIDGNYIAMMWERDSKEIAIAHHFRVRASSGNAWHQTWTKQPYRIKLSTVYDIGVLYGNGRKFQTTNALTSAVRHGDITFENGWTSTNIFPVLVTPSLTANAQSVDVLFKADP
jgi:hypothetical protein